MRAPRRGKVSLLLYPQEHLLIRNKGSLLDKTLWTDMEVRSSQCIYLPSTHFDIAKAGVQHCQEAAIDSICLTNDGLSLLLPFKWKGSVVSTISLPSKVRPESFLRSAVANIFFSLGTAEQIGP